ncbi:hypothetical protein RCL_jg589.t1 [Rhizophagus clarus]|uniref:Uncharacterized protein n=1 Tax=Rhizophagus clarus TaxID=94130 RepID=A0A8H3QRR2_9GLOM|nr:hypothetical protein RCL_jg589.t1 [Rhizophagus clarus]
MWVPVILCVSGFDCESDRNIYTMTKLKSQVTQLKALPSPGRQFLIIQNQQPVYQFSDSTGTTYFPNIFGYDFNAECRTSFE